MKTKGEVVELYQEVNRRREERYARRVSRAMRENAIDVELEKVKLFLGIYVYLLACAIWATM